jgi:hypothetical protein
MTIDLLKTPDYALTWLLEWAEEAAKAEKEELAKVRK